MTKSRLKMMFLFAVLLSAPIGFPLARNSPVVVDGTSSEWASLKAEHYSDSEEDSTGVDITGVSVHRQGDAIFFLMTFKDGICKNPDIRYFININTSRDSVSDFQIAVSCGTKGDTCRFKKDWSTFDFKTAEQAPGFQAAAGGAVEFRVPLSYFGGKKAFGFWAGAWDTKKNAVVDSVAGYYTTMKIAYTFTVIDPEKHVAGIEAQFTEIPDKNIDLHFPPNYPVGEIRVDNLMAKGKDGAPLKIIRTKEGYRVSTGESAKDFILTYILIMNQYHNVPVKGPTGYLCKEYMLTNTSWSLLSPSKESAKEYSLKLNLPSGWIPVMPWKKSGDLYVEKDPEIFRNTTFAAGDFEIQTQLVDGTEVTVAADRQYDTSYRKELFENSFTVFRYIKSLFGGKCPATHLSVFAKPQGEHEWQSYNENGLSQGEAVPDMRSAMYQFSHRVFHTFNGFYPCGMDIKPTWFMEGVNEYYNAMAMLRTKTEPPFKSLSDFYFNEYKKKHAALDASLKGDTRHPGFWEKEHFLAYKKGALAGLLLDLEIRRATKGAKSLGHLLAALYKKHSRFNGSITDDVIEKAASEVAGKDMRRFFNTHIYTKTYFNMDWHFSDDDKNGVCYAAEELLDH